LTRTGLARWSLRVAIVVFVIVIFFFAVVFLFVLLVRVGLLPMKNIGRCLRTDVAGI